MGIVEEMKAQASELESRAGRYRMTGMRELARVCQNAAVKLREAGSAHSAATNAEMSAKGTLGELAA